MYMLLNLDLDKLFQALLKAEDIIDEISQKTSKVIRFSPNSINSMSKSRKWKIFDMAKSLLKQGHLTLGVKIQSQN